MLTVGSIVIRVDDLEREKAFWSGALDYVAARATTTPFALLRPRSGDGAAEDQAGEVERLIGLGAREVQWDWKPADADYVILADPEGNRFCVIDVTR